MDSGNSGGLQSSTSGGGDDEFDSRCGGEEDSSPLSALLRQHPSAPASVQPAAGFGGSFYGTAPLSHAARWSTSSSSTPLGPLPAARASHSLPSSCQASSAAGQVVAEAPAPQAPVPAATPRGLRKRTRASRRAPTTVLTTDTYNFRAMVQEFTGVPAPPFAGGGELSSSSARSRFDHLFPSRSPAAPPLSPYLLRPFAAQKLVHHQASQYPQAFVTASSSASSQANNAIAASSSAPSTTAVGRNDGYQQLASAPSGVFGNQDHRSGNGNNYLSFQSLVGAQLDGTPRFSPAASHGFETDGGLPDPAGLMDIAHGIMNARHRGHGNYGGELSGLVGATSVSSADGCNKATTYSSGAGPRIARNAQITTPVAGAGTATAPAVATAVESSWISTSE